MGLEAYRKKRKLDKTPEPRPAPAPRPGGGCIFVVQKHFASHLHYDLRLEHDGVLKSWAIPKGPSMDPGDKRLAIQVEDHPYAYKDFAGRIPEGQYGAGVVEIWDSGTYTMAGDAGRGGAPKDMGESLKNGHLEFRLEGKKLRGRFTLVHIKGGKGNQWLLMKRSDNPPKRSDDPPAALKEPDFAGAVKGPMPAEISPMLATLADEPFDRDNWSFEVKWDGYRSLAEIRKGKVRLLSRNGRPQNGQFPSVAAALGKVPGDAVFDGEIVVLDARGRPSFQMLQNHLRSGKGEVTYYVFDILYARGYDLRKLPLRRRRAILKGLLPVSRTVRLSDFAEKEGRAFYRAAEKNGLEGIVAKDLDRPYLPGRRTPYWLKIKAQKGQEAIIAGFTRPRASRGYFGALVLGAYKDGALVSIGQVGTGFDEPSLKSIFGKLKPLIRARSPFALEPKANSPVTWVAPRLIAQVRFSEWTDDGKMRHPVFLGLRDDKDPREVRREIAQPAGEAAEMTVPKTRAKLTHLDKVYWPKEGFTKGDMIEYYGRIAESMLPYLKDRPQSLNRHPNGIAEEGFFQKNITEPPPAWAATAKIPSESGGRDTNALLCQNRDTLLYIANLGCIEINVWNSVVRHLDAPDYVVLDFDPLEAPFLSVVESVLAAKSLLEEMGLPAFVKTSGGKGMHVYVPLEPRFSHDQARELAHSMQLALSRRHPKLMSPDHTPENRKGKVYLDYAQNRRGSTMAAVYSLRPREGAPVSTPLEWKEVTAKLDPLDFNIRTVPERLSKKGDVWKDLFKKRADLNAVLAEFEKGRKKTASK